MANNNDTLNSTYEIHKVVVIGDSGVGKTNIVSRFTDDIFDFDTKNTIGVEFRTRMTKYNDTQVKLQIWDTAGQERYRAITTAYYRGAKGVLVVYDVTNEKSFSHLTRWLEEVDNYMTNPNIIIIGNKSDLKEQRTVKTQDAIDFAKHHNCAFMETSALTDNNIEEAFDYMTNVIVTKQQEFANDEAPYDEIQCVSILDKPLLPVKKSCCN